MKLIRDLIPEIAKRNGDTLKVRVAKDREIPDLLWSKVLEEALEVTEAKPEDVLEELGDLLEVVYTMADHYGYSILEIERTRVRKKIERGGFTQKFVMLTEGEE